MPAWLRSFTIIVLPFAIAKQWHALVVCNCRGACVFGVLEQEPYYAPMKAITYLPVIPVAIISIVKNG